MTDDTEYINPIFILIILLLIILICIPFTKNDCTGIGGFVYQEIEWSQQTYNVVSECQDLDGMNVPVLYYNDDKHQFYCIEKYDCNDNSCRYKDKYLDPIIQK